MTRDDRREGAQPPSPFRWYMLDCLRHLFKRPAREYIADAALQQRMRRAGVGAFYKNGAIYYASRAMSLRNGIREHELAHHRQAQMFGDVLYSVLYQIGAAFGYDRNPFEVHANKCERRTRRR